MLLKSFEIKSLIVISRSGGQEVEFHEIKRGGQITLQSRDQIFSSLFMRSTFVLIILSPDPCIFHEIKIH